MASENYFAHLTECQTERREEGRERVKRVGQGGRRDEKEGRAEKVEGRKRLLFSLA